jgi:demethylmenaquinone methyltransferase/2-methoxy-6-polyprenyl-1,4-benzoquinol methylase
LNLSPGERILDIATGTAQLALAAAALAPSDVRIVGCDRNERMLRVGQERIRAARPKAPVDLLRCMGEAMPFRDSAFDGAMIAFAIDDMEDRHACAGEIFRVLKPGGQLVLLELSLPDFPLLLGLYRIYLRLFPLIGRLFSRGSYEHLREEILAYRGRLAIKELLSETGFIEYRWEGLSGGIVTVHVARKPE